MEQIIHTDRSATPLLVTIPEAARLLAVGRSTLYELISSGQVITVHIGRSVRLPVEELRRFVDRRVVAGATVSPVRETAGRRHPIHEEAMRP